MYNIDLQWQSFPVNMTVIEAWLRANAGPLYVGNSSDDDLTLHFSDQPDDATVQHIRDYWSGLTTASPEATSYVTNDQLKSAAATLKASCVGVAWDSMTPAQQKSVLNLPLTQQDLGL